MDLSNRAIIIGLSLLLIAFAVVVVLLAWMAPQESIDRIGDLSGYLNDHNDRAAKLIVTFGALIFALLGAIMIILEIAPATTGAVKVAKVGSGEALIGTDEVAQQLERELRSTPRIADAQVTVTGRGKKADIKLDLFVTADAELHPTAEDAIQRARQLVEGRMGVELASPPQVQVHYRELRVAPPPQPREPAPSFTPRPSSPYAPPPASAAPGSSTPPTSDPFRPTASHEATEATAEDRPTVS